MFTPTQFANEVAIVFRRSLKNRTPCRAEADRLTRERHKTAIENGLQPSDPERLRKIAFALACAAAQMMREFEELEDELRAFDAA